jgi:putative transposase
VRGRSARRRPALRFEAFVAELLAWVAWWNTENVMPALKGRTPLQAWLEDPTPLTTAPGADLRLLMLEDDGRTRKITTKGVAWRARQYVAAWMTGQAGCGTCRTTSTRSRYSTPDMH